MPNIENNKFLTNVLTLLESIERIETENIDNKIIGLYKNNTLFGLVIRSGLYLRTNKNNQLINAFKENITFQRKEYSKVNKQLLEEENDKDIFYKQPHMLIGWQAGK